MKGVDTWGNVKQYIYVKSVGKEHPYKTKTGYCGVCNRREYAKQHYEKNKTEILAKKRVKNAPTKEANRLKREQYKIEHKEELEQKKQEQIERRREWNRQYARSHKVELNEYKREYFKKHEEKKREHYKRCAEYLRKRCEEDPEYREKRNAYHREKMREVRKQKRSKDGQET